MGLHTLNERINQMELLARCAHSEPITAVPPVIQLDGIAEESKDGWCALLQELRARGVNQIDLLVTNGHEGLLAAVADLFPTTLRQRCLVLQHHLQGEKRKGSLEC